MEGAICRLTTVTLKTNLRGEETTDTEPFGIVDRASMVRQHNREVPPGALLGCSIASNGRIVFDWDINGARGILLRALYDNLGRFKAASTDVVLAPEQIKW